MKKNILLIDDDRLFLKFVTRTLEDAGHEITTAQDGISALDILTRYTPDIIFLDLILPKIDGDRLCRIIRKMKHLQRCYLVVVSAVVAELQNDFGQIGADAYIAKGPFADVAEHMLASVAAAAPGESDQARPVWGLESVHPRQLTRELLSRNRHLKTILESMSEAILEVIDEKIVYANSAAVALLGLSHEKIIGSPPLDLFTGKTRKRVKALVRSATGKPAEIGEKQPLDLRGRLVTVKVLPVSENSASSIVLISDITERKRLELQLQHAQKMEAIGTISSGVAHNFRNTLTGILANSQVIQENYPEEDELMEVVGRIDSSVRTGAQMVNRLMQFSRKESHEEVRPVDLVAVLTETYHIIRNSFDKKIDIRFDLPPTLPIMGDHASLSQVFMNLFTNARDSMPEGGLLDVRARRHNGRAEVRVADTGQGMDVEARKKCFDPFFTTKEVGKGTGLGLSTTYGIVKSHDGEIAVDSEIGKGTCFELRFPITTEKIPEAKTPAEIVRGKGEPIMVVEDEPEVRIALSDLLKSLGYRPLLAVSGEQAIASYKANHPQVVLMDVNLPAENGYSCAEKILRVDPQARIAILSGYNCGAPELADKDVHHAIRGYLTKPVDIIDLSTLLARLIV